MANGSFRSREVAMAVILPKDLLHQPPELSSNGFVLDRKALTAVHNAKADDGIPRLPVGNIIRAFQTVRTPAKAKPASESHPRAPKLITGLRRRSRPASEREADTPTSTGKKRPKPSRRTSAGLSTFKS